MHTRGGQQQMLVGIAQTDALLGQASTGNVNFEHIQDLLKSFRERKGLDVSDAKAGKMCDLLQCVQEITDTTCEVCELALIMFELVPAWLQVEAAYCHAAGEQE